MAKLLRAKPLKASLMFNGFAPTSLAFSIYLPRNWNCQLPIANSPFQFLAVQTLQNRSK
jgi:hypothetical protein